MRLLKKHTACLIFCGILLALSFNAYGQKTSARGFGGNPLPQFCHEPCDVQLTRWFEIVIEAGNSPLTVKDFEFKGIYHGHSLQHAPLIVPQNKLHTTDWYLMDSYGIYPAAIRSHGIKIEDDFFRFDPLGPASMHPVIPAGETGVVVLQLHVVVPSYRCLPPGNTMPNGHYALRCELELASGVRVDLSTDPIIACSGGSEKERVAMMQTEHLQTALHAAPNPFHTRTKCSFELAEDAAVSLSLYNLQGQRVMNLMQDKLFDAGTHEVAYTLDHLPSGMYLLRLETPKGTETVRIVKE